MLLASAVSPVVYYICKKTSCKLAEVNYLAARRPMSLPFLAALCVAESRVWKIRR